MSIRRSPAALALRRWKALVSVYLRDAVAYRASMAIWVITDVVTAITMPIVLIAASGGGEIHGFSSGDFVVYYLSMLMIGSFVTSHLMWDIALEIKEGVFSSHLVRPLGYFEFCVFRNLAWRLIRTMLFLPWFVTFLILFSGYLGGTDLFFGWQFWLSVLLGHAVSLTLVVALAMIALFVQEAFAIFELYYLPMLFLSGQIFPIALFPDWARDLAVIFPFYYTIGAPTEILIQVTQGPDIARVLLMQGLWIVLSFGLFKLLWRQGTRHYTGVGM